MENEFGFVPDNDLGFVEEQDNNAPSQESPTEESYLGSVVKAPFRVVGDIAGLLANAILSAPRYAEKARSEIPGAYNLIKEHPSRALSQATAGLTELGHETLNLPKNIADYSSNRLHLLSKAIADKIPYQRDISEEINAAFGAPQYPGEELIRGTVRNLPAFPGIANVTPNILRTINPTRYTAKNIANSVVNTKNAMRNKYSGLYGNLWNEAIESGVGDLKNIAPNIDIETLRKYSPSRDIIGVEEFIKNPTLQTAHNAKSDLLSIQRKLDKLTTKRTAERKQAKAIADAIENIQGNMFKRETGEINPELLNQYNRIQKGYKEEVVPYTTNKDIRSFENKEISPKELLSKLNHGKFAAQRGKYHPEIKRRESIRDALVKLGIGGGVGVTGKTLYDYLTGNKEY